MPGVRAGDRKVRKTNRTHSRHCGDTGEQLAPICREVEILIATGTRIELDLKDMVVAEAEVDGAQLFKTADQQARAKQQDHRKGDLRNDERFAQFADSAG